MKQKPTVERFPAPGLSSAPQAGRPLINRKNTGNGSLAEGYEQEGVKDKIQVKNEKVADTSSFTPLLVLSRIPCTPSTTKKPNKQGGTEAVKPSTKPQTVVSLSKHQKQIQHKLIAVKSSHLTRRGRLLAVEQSTKTFTSLQCWKSKPELRNISPTRNKTGNILLVLIATTPTAAATVHRPALLYLNGNFLTRFHAPS